VFGRYIYQIYKKSSVFEWHRWFKEGWEDVQDDPASGQPRMQRTDANVDRVWALVHSERRLRVRLIAQELNMNSETVRQIIMKDLGMRKIFRKDGVSNLGRWPEITLASHFIWSITQRREVNWGHYQWWNVFSIRPGNKMTWHAVENTEFTLAEKSTQV
jgi:hypothetical protein